MSETIPDDILSAAVAVVDRGYDTGLIDAVAAALMAERERWKDKVDGLEADLANAVETAFKRGAVEWTKLNYPGQYQRLAVIRTPSTGEEQ